MQDARAGKLKLLYTSPETLLRPETLKLLDESALASLAIDEAHCISQWGHDFRPEYRQLLDVRRRYRDAVCIALTATATPRVQQDIQASLGFGDADVFVASFNRRNLQLAVQPRTGGLSQVLTFLQDHRDQSGIIYCSTRDQVDSLAAQLAERGWPALPYHAGLDDGTRHANQRRFVREDVRDHGGDHRLRHGNQQVQRALRAALQPAQGCRKLLPGDRPLRSRWAAGRLPAAVQPVRRVHHQLFHQRGRGARTAGPDGAPAGHGALCPEPAVPPRAAAGLLRRDLSRPVRRVRQLPAPARGGEQPEAGQLDVTAQARLFPDLRSRHRPALRRGPSDRHPLRIAEPAGARASATTG